MRRRSKKIKTRENFFLDRTNFYYKFTDCSVFVTKHSLKVYCCIMKFDKIWFHTIIYLYKNFVVIFKIASMIDFNKF